MSNRNKTCNECIKLSKLYYIAIKNKFLGMPMRSHNAILLFGLLVIISLTRALPLDAEEELDSNDVEDR